MGKRKREEGEKAAARSTAPEAEEVEVPDTKRSRLGSDNSTGKIKLAP